MGYKSALGDSAYVLPSIVAVMLMAVIIKYIFPNNTHEALGFFLLFAIYTQVLLLRRDLEKRISNAGKQINQTDHSTEVEER